MAVLGILGAFSVPMVSSAASGVKLRDHANAIADLIGLAKLRATSEFSRSRLYANLAAESYRIQTWDADAGAWVDEQAAVELPNGVRFGWGDLEEPPPNTQDELKFAAECVDEDGEVIEQDGLHHVQLAWHSDRQGQLADWRQRFLPDRRHRRARRHGDGHSARPPLVVVGRQRRSGYANDGRTSTGWSGRAPPASRSSKPCSR